MKRTKFPHPKQAPSGSPPHVTLRCRVCGRKFAGPYGSYLESSLLVHIESAHPDEALPFNEEFSKLAVQVEEVFRQLGLSDVDI